MQDNHSEKRSRLARDVLRLSRNRLLVSLRFLDAALSRLTWLETEAIPFGTDGKLLAYDPRHILLGYKAERTLPVRNYLHSVLHCVFRHNFIHSLANRTLWDLACDIAVEPEFYFMIASVINGFFQKVVQFVMVPDVKLFHQGAVCVCKRDRRYIAVIDGRQMNAACVDQARSERDPFRGIMVSADNKHVQFPFREAPEEIIEQFHSFRRWNRLVIYVAGDDDRVRLCPVRHVQYLPQDKALILEHAEFIHALAQMQV